MSYKLDCSCDPCFVLQNESATLIISYQKLDFYWLWKNKWINLKVLKIFGNRPISNSMWIRWKIFETLFEPVVKYGKSRMIHVISQVRKLMLKEIEFGTENNLFWRKTELDLTHRFQNTNEWFQEKRLWLPKYFKQFLWLGPCEPKLGQIFAKSWLLVV